jgi:hypothetical protein
MAWRNNKTGGRLSQYRPAYGLKPVMGMWAELNRHLGLLKTLDMPLVYDTGTLAL